jgi:L-ascorbate metabolism protein UlaG (beta-lactamase superfamily)
MSPAFVILDRCGGTRRRRKWRPTAWLAPLALASALPLDAAVALLSADGGGGSAPPVVVTHLGNEGVRIAAGETRVLVDALFGEGIAGYSVVAPAVRDEIEAARGEFAGVDLVLATHAHADHFDAAAVARHLVANPDARFVSTPEAVDAVLALPAGRALALRLRASLPSEGASETIRYAGIAVTVFQLHHGREMRRPAANLGFLVELGGRRILHVGDTEATADELAATGLAEPGVDLALVPYWRLLAPPGRAAIRDAFAPRRVAAFHLPTPAAPADWWGVEGGLDGLRRAIAAVGSDTVVLAEPGQSIDLGGEPPRRPGR